MTAFGLAALLLQVAIDLCVLGVGLVGSRNIVATAADLAPKRVLWNRFMAWLSVIRPQGRADAAVPVKLVMDLRIAHERRGRSSNPILNIKLHHPLPADIDLPFHDAVAEAL
jgi:hypothetical protein